MSSARDAANPLICAIAIVMLDMGWRDNKRAPLELWQIDEIRLCCGDPLEQRPTVREIERGWKLARRADASAAAFYECCKKAIAS